MQSIWHSTYLLGTGHRWSPAVQQFSCLLTTALFSVICFEFYFSDLGLWILHIYHFIIMTLFRHLYIISSKFPTSNFIPSLMNIPYFQMCWRTSWMSIWSSWALCELSDSERGKDSSRPGCWVPPWPLVTHSPFWMPIVSQHHWHHSHIKTSCMLATPLLTQPQANNTMLVLLESLDLVSMDLRAKIRLAILLLKKLWCNVLHMCLNRWMLSWMAGASAGKDSRKLHCSCQSWHNHYWSQYLWVHETVPIWPEPQPGQLWLGPGFWLGESPRSWEKKEEGWNLPYQVTENGTWI